jgi:glycosyltransferase involved in cell wall biosynthesis
MLRAEKAYDLLIAAAARLPGAHVLIAGFGEERERLEAQIAAEGLEGRVRLLGHRADVPDLVRAFDVAVCCSDFEGMPVSVLEYMEAGLPVVATRVGGLPDLVGGEGLLVPPRDPDALAAALAELLADPERRRAMGDRARERRRAEFGLDTMIRRIEDVYVELLDGRR